METASIPVDRTTKKEIPSGFPFLFITKHRQELRVGAVLQAQNTLPKKEKECKKQTIKKACKGSFLTKGGNIRQK